MFGFFKKRAQDEADGLRTLRGQVEDLETSVRRLKGEWMDALDRFERIAGRIVKRAQRADAASPATEDESPPGTAMVPSHTVNGGGSYAAAQVAMRRSRVVPGPATRR